MPSNVFRLGSAALAALLLACSSDGGTGTTGPARLGLSVEPDATAQSGVAFAPPPVVQVLDIGGAPVAVRGLLITASLASGGGTLAGTVAVRTDVDGRAAFTDLVLNGPVGAHTLRFSASGLSAVISRSIHLTSGPATLAVINAGNSQTSAAGTPVPVAPAVKVTDGSDNPVVGVRVIFAVTGGGGTITGPQPLTNAQGIATLGQWTLGTGVGQNVLSATVDGIGTPLTFQATGTVGPAAQFTLIEGDGQSATLGAAVTISPAVKVTDAFGNLVTGLAVPFIVGSGGGTVTGGAPVSDANGIARVGAWRLGLVPGANTLLPTLEGVPPLTFTANGLDLPITAIAAGVAHACATGIDNVTRCWGDNSVGQLGNGTFQPDSAPVTVSGSTVFTQVVAGAGHTCALTVGGVAWCWGNNTFGELGTGNPPSSNVPVLVAGGLTFTQISSSLLHTCALDGTGKAWCWGNGGNGRLGDGAQTSRTRPTLVGGGHIFTQISAGGAHTCARRNDGVVLCWGLNTNGRLGDATTDNKLVPTPVSGATLFTAVSAGGTFTCGLDNLSAAWCWGANTSGQVGDGTSDLQWTVPRAVSGGRTFTSVVAGVAHACGITSQSAAYCWGENASGRLGDGTAIDRKVPTAVSGGGAYAALTANDQHTCARSTSGSAICWGNGTVGQLGDGTRVSKGTPVGVKQP